MQQKTIISLGAGVQSSALVIMAIKGNIHADYAIFCDTGSERQETYQYLKEVLLPFADQHSFRLITIKYDSEYNTRQKPLHQWYFDDGSLPFRINRGCTDNWKIRPFRRYLKQYEQDGAIILLGFSLDDVHRMKESDNPKYPNRFPLIDKKITRQELITKWFPKWNVPVPPKSGCFMCPFQRKTEWLSLRDNHPEQFQFSIQLENHAQIELEKQGQAFFPLNGNFSLTKFENHSQSLLDFLDDDPPCESSCLT
jgi:3'-phosphoadenosine 5'-phosphosulfate sulfotransferase (PAPS reductase)/FAD synthetase